MQRRSKVVVMPISRVRKPIPALIVQGLPGSVRDRLLTELNTSDSSLEVWRVNGFPDLEDEDKCTQCDLIRSFVDQTLKAISEIGAKPENPLLWIEVPVELDVTRFSEALMQLNGVFIHSVVTCIDSTRFFSDYSSDRSFEERFLETNEASEGISKAALHQPVIEALIDQIECCDFIHVTAGEDLPEVLRFLRRLHPRAQFVESGSDLAKKLRAERAPFDPEITYRSAAWQLALRDVANPSTACFRSRRPFHPMRLSSLIERWPESIIRSCGTVWIASHNHLSLALSQIGPSGFFLSPEGKWIGTLTPLEQRAVLQKHPELRENWDDDYGDRMNEIAFVSSEPIPHDWFRQLENCLLSELEMRMNWSRFENPFPSFEDDEVTEENEIQ